MNKPGNFLYGLRKGKGMTQEALAKQLGVSNKAVSKWETGESMPETSLLLPLARVFGVTADELLNGAYAADGQGGTDDDTCGTAQKSEEIGREETEGYLVRSKSTGNHLCGRLFTRGKDDGPESLAAKISGAVCAVIMLGGIAVYLFIGALADLWHPCWLIVIAGIVAAIGRCFQSKK